MNNNIVRFSLFSVLALTLLSVSAVAQATNVTTTTKIPLSGNLAACNGESVPYEGSQNYLIHSTTSSSGQVSIKVSISFNLKGVGDTTGVNYVANGAQEASRLFDITDDTPFNLIITGHLNLNGQGRVPNTILRVVAHTTINANGDVTSTSLRLTSECR